MPELYIGLMSGTSMDGIDAVIASFDDGRVDIEGTLQKPYPDTLRRALLNAVTTPVDQAIGNIGALDRQVGECFRDAARELLESTGIAAGEIRAIGSHGQTIRHQPDAVTPYSLQIGNPALIAAGTGIRTVADFRSADIAAGGQGAPLVPPFHQWLFGGTNVARVILNIGGIANLTVLRGNGSPVVGFDTGPGNTLLDRWVQTQQKQPFDQDGAWAASGQSIAFLLEDMLTFPYFDIAPPKSTGLDDFNLEWLAQFNPERFAAVDVQATLAELTARTVANGVRKTAPDATELYVCGGGAHNKNLLDRLARNLPKMSVGTTTEVGLDPDWVEAVAFAWLAMRTMNNEPGNLPSVTGASSKVVLGEIHSP